jgi:hypothetical protein
MNAMLIPVSVILAAVGKLLRIVWLGPPLSALIIKRVTAGCLLMAVKTRAISLKT